MGFVLSTENTIEYLKEDDVIDFGHESIKQLADTLHQSTNSEVEYVKKGL